MVVKPPIVGRIFDFDVTRDLTGEVQSVDRTKYTLEERVSHGYISTKLEKLITKWPSNRCRRHPLQDLEQDGQGKVKVSRDSGCHKCEDLLKADLSHC